MLASVMVDLLVEERRPGNSTCRYGWSLILFVSCRTSAVARYPVGNLHEALRRVAGMAHTSAVSRLASRPRLGRRPARLPSQTSTTDAEEDPPVDFSTLVGSLSEVESVIGRWDQLVDAITLRRMVPPRVLPLSRTAQEYADDILSVAVIVHPPGLGRRLVAGLRDQLPRFGLGGVVADMGYFLSPVATPAASPGDASTRQSWSVTWRPEHLDDLLRPIPLSLPPAVLGASSVPTWPRERKVALLDTGDEGATRQVGFELDHSGEENPSDSSGHGTSVGDLIRVAASHTMVDSISVEERYQQHRVQRMIDGYAGSGTRVPVLVCAAGKYCPNELIDYPATVPGVVVAMGLDWSGEIADYNCPPLPGTDPFVVGAYGGVEHDPLGTISRPGIANRTLYGSSYATALVAATVASL